jgi:microcystin-dependent protein
VTGQVEHIPNLEINVSPNVTFHPDAIGIAGGDQSHENRQPFLALNFCICLSGIFPSK